MSVPDYQSLMAPVLRVLSTGEDQGRRPIAEAVAAEVGITDDDRALLLPSGRQPVWRNRIGWAVQYLYQAQAIERVRRGTYRITDRGRQLLADHPDGITRVDLEGFEQYQAFLARSRASTPGSAATPVPPVDSLDTPTDRLARAAEEVNAAVAAELLSRINEQPPAFLERVVLQLLAAMGYAGRRGSTEQLGRSGDEGVDGVVRQDALGLDQIYVQAKRYASGRTVGRPEIQAFVGALHGAQASRGVFLTTSRFSSEAVEYAERVQQRLVLIDGEEMARLMLTNGVGVQEEQRFIVMKIDEDFFD